jgi:hypothetical protein
MAQLAHLKTIILNGVPLSETTMVQLRHINQLSPWEEPQGIERARLAREPDNKTGALSAPVTLRNSEISMEHLPEAPSAAHLEKITTSGSKQTVAKESHSKWSLFSKTPPRTGAPMSTPSLSGHESPVTLSAPDKIATGFSNNASTDGSQTLKQAKVPRLLKVPDENPSVPPPAELAMVPVSAKAPSTRKPDEDQLLKVIRLQSQPSKGGGFSGLAGMKQVRLAENNGSIGDVMDPLQANIRMQEDRPEDSLGEISINASHH